MSSSFGYELVDPSAPAPTSPAVAFTRAAYARLLRLLYPPGKLLSESPTLDKLNDGFAGELARVDERAKTAVAESDPRTAVETLENWERMLGLPDEFVTSIPTTTAERQAAIAQKFASRGGQNYAFFVRLCDLCGYVLNAISVYHTATLRALTGRVLDRVFGTTFSYHMVVTVLTPGAGALPTADFERVIRNATHSHITVTFIYA